MKFYLGTHQPSWLGRVTEPLFVSFTRLRGQKKLPRRRGAWALDSGGYTELSRHGEWTVTAAEYAEAATRYDREIGHLDWAAPQDWMCEPWILQRTGLTVADHQLRTVENFAVLERFWFDYAENSQWSSPFMPVLQGWTLDDYWRCVELYAEFDIRLADYPVVGLGSVCRRESTEDIGRIVRSLGGVLPLHGFGVKTRGIARYGRWLESADSMAWSIRGRGVPGCSEGHATEANCLPYALSWREQVLNELHMPEKPGEAWLVA